MCDIHGGAHKSQVRESASLSTVAVQDAVGHVLAHDMTEIVPGQFKGVAFRKGHVVRAEDIERLQRIGKERLFVVNLSADEMHEDEAALSMAKALSAAGVQMRGEPREGKISLVAAHDGLLKVNREALLQFNMLGEVMCATLHDNTVVQQGREVAATRAIPLVIRRSIVEDAVAIAQRAGGVLQVRRMMRPRVGIVITGNEVFSGRIEDAFAPVIRQKVQELQGEVLDVRYAPDDTQVIQEHLSQLLSAGADMLITTGGMSVDPDDVTRYAIRELGAQDITYGSPVLPGAMILTAYIEHGTNGTRRTVPIVGIPACGMYHRTTVFDLVLPRLLAGERIGRRELAEMGHGGLCLHCKTCFYPVCPFGK